MAPIPVITKVGLQSSRKGVAITPLQIMATGSPTFYGANRLPLGLTLSPSTGEITGTPLKVESMSIKVRAANSSGWSIPVEFEWVITATTAEEAINTGNKTAEAERATFAKTVEKQNQSSSWSAPSGWGVRR